MFDIGMPELLIVLVIIVLIFGPGRLAKTMSELGKGIRSFKDSFSSSEEDKSSGKFVLICRELLEVALVSPYLCSLLSSQPDYFSGLLIFPIYS